MNEAQSGGGGVVGVMILPKDKEGISKCQVFKLEFRSDPGSIL